MNNFSAATSVTILAQQMCATYLTSNCAVQRASIITHYGNQARNFRSAFKAQVTKHVKFQRQLCRVVPEDILLDFDL